MITADPIPRQQYLWTCPDCGKTGTSATHHGATSRLRAHWRTCPDPRRSEAGCRS